MAHIAPAEAGDAGFADVSDDAGSAVPPLPPIPPAPKASKFCPRITWTTLHVVGLGLLHLSGMWSPQLLSVSMLDAVTILALLTLLFIAASIIDPLPSDGRAAGENDAAEQASEQFSPRWPLVELPSCMHCQARQGARAKHCHDCGRCVRRLDHHCWWLGTCVGAGNHRLFVSYLFCEAALLCAAGGEASAGLMMDDTARARRAPIPAIASASAVGCLGMCATLGLLALTLLAFQLSLIPGERQLGSILGGNVSTSRPTCRHTCGRTTAGSGATSSTLHAAARSRLLPAALVSCPSPPIRSSASARVAHALPATARVACRHRSRPLPKARAQRPRRAHPMGYEDMWRGDCWCSPSLLVEAQQQPALSRHATCARGRRPKQTRPDKLKRITKLTAVRL